MKRIVQLIALVALCGSATAQTTVKGEYISTKGRPTPKFAYLFTSGNSKGIQSKIENGKFGFELPAQDKGKLTYGFIYFSSKTPFGMPERIKEKRHDFVVEKGAVSVTYNSAKSYFVAKGGVLNQQQRRIYALDSIRELEARAKNANFDAINQMAGREYLNMVRECPTSPVAQNYFCYAPSVLPKDSATYKELSTLFQSMPADFKESEKGKRFAADIERIKLLYKNKGKVVGASIADLQLTGPDKTTTKLSANGSKLILLDFWATWCGPCKKAQPKLAELQNKYGSKGLSVIGVSLDKNITDWTSYLKSKPHTYTQLWTDWEKAKEHPLLTQIQHVPTLVLVDAQTMKVVKWDVKVDDVEKEITQLLK
jgi:Thiol-disulfide isomerase and thioredoxins